MLLYVVCLESILVLSFQTKSWCKCSPQSMRQTQSSGDFIGKEVNLFETTTIQTYFQTVVDTSI